MGAEIVGLEFLFVHYQLTYMDEIYTWLTNKKHIKC